MKTAVFASLFASAAAFAPASQRATIQTSHSMSAELEGMIGADVETGGRIVSDRDQESKVVLLWNAVEYSTIYLEFYRELSSLGYYLDCIEVFV